MFDEYKDEIAPLKQKCCLARDACWLVYMFVYLRGLCACLGAEILKRWSEELGGLDKHDI